MIKSVKYNSSENILVFDDGGFVFSNPDHTGFKIDFSVYDRILTLAKKHEIVIPIASTAAFFDIDNISDLGLVNPDADRLIRYFQDNQDYIKLWNHGLTHVYEKEFTEFYSYNTGGISREYQEEHLKISQAIFKNINLEPDVFVPPGHAWESNLTDLYARKHGLKSIAIREFEKTSGKAWAKSPFKPYKSEWSPSEHLATLFRLGLGIAHDSTSFSRQNYIKSWHYINNLIPFSFLTNRKFILAYPVDHFFAHVQNMQDEGGLVFFDKVISWIRKAKNKDNG